jgi:hypothetical protein
MPTDDDEVRRHAEAILRDVSLGDWSILIDEISPDLEDVYNDGMSEGLRLLEIDVPVDHVHARAVEWARERAASLVTAIEENTRDMLRATVANALEERWGARELADAIATSAAFSDDRSEMIARTEISASNNQGNLDGYKVAAQSGVRVLKEWLSDNDDECGDNSDDGPIELDDEFSSGDDAPPAHPNAVFAGSLFAPYGCVRQALRSRYDGPAVTIDAVLLQNDGEFTSSYAASFDDFLERDILCNEFQREGDLLVRDRGCGLVGISAGRIRLTIGPNHPILTRRGFVIACEIHKGDQLLYDERVIRPAAGIEFDFKQMPFVEDAVSALDLHFGHAMIAGASSYFHGDEVACYGEVDVIRPASDLLPVLDPCGIEHLGKCDFVWPYPDATHVASCGACFSKFEGIFLTASRRMSRSGGGVALLRSCAAPPFFHSFAVIACHRSHFSGWAFDASTASGLYNYGGLVVKNCRCSLSPVVVDEEGRRRGVICRPTNLSAWS